MSNISIKVEELGKRFNIANILDSSNNMRQLLTKAFSYPFQMLAAKQRPGQLSTHEFWALRNLSFEVGQGEVIGIIGRNGSGKSTLLKVLSRITEPTEGRAILRGRVASLLEVGSGFHPELSGRENIYMNGAIMGMRKQEIDRKLDEIVAFAETGQFLDTAIKHYSSGMYMRLAFAVAAHLEAEILFVDEVLAVGDASFQRKCLGRMQSIAEGGRSVMFVSHNLTTISTLCHKTLHLDSGRIVAYGPTDEVVSRYLIPDVGGAIFDKRQFRENKYAELHGARILQDGTPGPFITSRPIQVEIDYELKTDIVGFRCGLDVMTPDGLVLWRTWDDDMSGEGATCRRAGRYLATCTLPADTFCPRSYVLALSMNVYTGGAAVGGPNLQWISQGTVQQSIQFHNAGGVGSAYGGEERAGALLMGLPWTTEALKDATKMNR